MQLNLKTPQPYNKGTNMIGGLFMPCDRKYAPQSLIQRVDQLRKEKK